MSLVRCSGKGAPVQGCHCTFCQALRPTIAPTPKPERIAIPSGDFDEDDKR